MKRSVQLVEQTQTAKWEKRTDQSVDANKVKKRALKKPCLDLTVLLIIFLRIKSETSSSNQVLGKARPVCKCKQGKNPV